MIAGASEIGGRETKPAETGTGVVAVPARAISDRERRSAGRAEAAKASSAVPTGPDRFWTWKE